MSRPSGEVEVDEKRVNQEEVGFGRNIILAIDELFRKLTLMELDLLLWNFQETVSFCGRDIINKFERFGALTFNSQQLVERP